MPTVVGIRFKKACKIYYFDPAETGVQKGDFAIVETARAARYGCGKRKQGPLPAHGNQYGRQQ